jgi:hypothetical protein
VTRIGAWLRGVGVGAATTYFFDPDVGRRRRALVRDRAAHLARVVRVETSREVRHTGDRLRGLVASTRRLGRSAGAGLPVVERRVHPTASAPADPTARLAIGLVGAAAVLPFCRHVPVLLAARLLALGALGSAVYGVERTRRRAIASVPVRAAGDSAAPVPASPR